MYIDVHTHNPTAKKNRFEIISCFPEQDIDAKKYYSIGLHPWFIQNPSDNTWIDNINEKIKNKNVIAIGEAGLDRITKIDFDVQQKIFAQQLEIAQENNLPVFIHCVRAYSELLWHKKQIKNPTPWIIHGFKENYQIAAELIKHDCYLSFGKDLYLARKNIKTGFPKIPLDRIFLETDDYLGKSIDEIYMQAAFLLNIPEDVLKNQIYYNFEKIFPGILKNERLAEEN